MRQNTVFMLGRDREHSEQTLESFFPFNIHSKIPMEIYFIHYIAADTKPTVQN